MALPRETKEIKRLRRERAGYDFNLQLFKFLDTFKSKEEPKITLTAKEKAILMLGYATSIVERESLQ